MYILGINDGHLATAALLKDNEIIACVSEERFTKTKNQSGLPIKSIEYCLDIAKIKPRDLDLVVISSKLLPPTTQSNRSTSLVTSFYKYLKIVQLHLLTQEQRLPLLKQINNFIYDLVTVAAAPYFRKTRKQPLIDKFGFDDKKIIFSDHHLTHAYTALFSSEFAEKQEKVLVLTCDSEGDKLCATVNIFKNNKLKVISKTSFNDSLGNLYASVTIYLGMKHLEHEYKVMGLAPYASEFETNKVFEKIKDLITVDKKKLTFKSKVNAHTLREGYLDKIFYRTRFDNIAAATQKLTELRLIEWITEAIKQTAINNIACSGGVFMNIKANQKIYELSSVKKAFFMPSSGDESNAIGACYFGFRYLKPKQIPKPITNLYLGPKNNLTELNVMLKKLSPDKYKITKPKNLNKQIAKLLSKNQIIAISRGRMEWGARALGNRSILANAKDPENLQVINKMIKSRDFWMPFAPVIIDSKQKEYFNKIKPIDPKYMIITFDSTKKAQNDLAAAVHPYDKTLRPQVITEKDNPDYYQVLKEFEKITGIGGLLNTSFNLHGEPIVSTPEDAVQTFINSGLNYLVLENYLIQKLSLTS